MIQSPAVAPPASGIAGELPIAQHRERIVQAIERHPVLVLAGETGSGKSTQLPRYCLDMGRGALRRIAHTQPRRLAARALATRIAAERGEAVGHSVGYRVRFTDEVSRHTRLVLLTDGLLLAEVARDPLLESYDTLIIDEAHERTLNIDLLLGVAKRVLASRPDFRLVVASATLDIDRVARFFGDAPVIDVGGRLHPVEVRYRPASDAPMGEEPDLPSQVQAAVREILEHPGEGGGGDVLVFLPGEREIRDVGDALAAELPPGMEILPLYSRLPWEQQRRIFDAGGTRRLILSTNVAETSITVPRVRFVIDSGLARISRYSPSSRLQRLPIEPVARASCEQRKGRCGRVGPGVCIRLYGEADFEARPAFTEAEVLRTNLSALLLRLAADGLGNAEEFPFIDPPERRALNDGYRTLVELGALDEANRITSHGRAMARLPVEPRLARALLESKRFRAAGELLAIASGLSVPDPWIRIPGNSPIEPPAFEDARSEFLSLVRLWRAYRLIRRRPRRELRQWCREKHLSLIRLSEWENVHGQLADRARELGIVETPASASYTAVHRSLLAGFCSHVGVHEERGLYAGVRNTKFAIFPGSPLKRRQPRWILAANIIETSRVFARTVAQIEPSWIEPAARHLVRREHFEADWSEARDEVVARERVSLLGLTLTTGRIVNYGPVAPGEAQRVFAREAIVHRRMTRRPGWLVAHDASIDAARRVEDRVRSRGLLASADTLTEFYVQCLPRQISSAPALEAWTRRCIETQQSLPELPGTVIFAHPPDATALAAAPESIGLEAMQLRVSYRFEPDHPEDGATLHVPLLLVPRLTRRAIEACLPGIELQRYEAWMRALPKTMRRDLIPIAETARHFLSDRRQEALPDFGEWLHRHRGLPRPEIDAARGALPPHLLPRLLIHDGSREIAQGRDWPALRRSSAAQAQGALAAQARARFGEPWRDFAPEPLPRVQIVTLPEGSLEVHVGLADAQGSVRVEFHYTQGEAAAAHRRGVLRLLGGVLAPMCRDLSRRLSLDSALLLAASPFARSAELTDAILTQSLLKVGGDVLEEVRDRPAFATLVLRCREQLYDAFDAVCAHWRGWYADANTLRQLLQQAPVREDLRAEAQSHLSELASPTRWEALPATRITHLRRYLKAATLRWRKLAGRPAENPAILLDLLRWREERHRILGRFAEQRRWTAELEAFDWAVEEYRSSLSAQELRTAEPASEPRLRQRLAGLQAWLEA
ncbi:MAG: ATP-dependent RNA helicase HrpA [Steroidobacteraceae bacterium]